MARIRIQSDVKVDPFVTTHSMCAALLSTQFSINGTCFYKSIKFFVFLWFSVFGSNLAVTNKVQIMYGLVNGHLFGFGYCCRNFRDNLLIIAAADKQDSLTVLWYAIV